MSRRGLQALLAGMGTVVAIAGASGMLRGPVEVPEAGRFTANIDSEYRFYATWYHLAGLALLGAARRPEAATGTVRLFSAGLLGAGCMRVVSLRRLGPPHRSQVALMTLEFLIPAVVLPWQARVAARMAEPA